MAQAADDGGQHAGQFGADQQQPFLIGLGGQDLQQRDEFVGVGQPVGDQGEVGDLQQFLEADPGVAQGFDDRPRPERVVLALRDLDGLAGGEVFDEDDLAPVCVLRACRLLVGDAAVAGAVVVERLPPVVPRRR